MAKGETARANKRKFGSGKGSPYAHAPRKGPPAIFVSCESGREKKCQIDALELMHHYYYISRHESDEQNEPTTQLHPDGEKDVADINNKTTNTNNYQMQQEQEEKPLSLEEELSLLRKGVMAEEVLTYDGNSKRQKVGTKDKKKVSSMKSPFSAYDSGVRGMICILCNLPGSEVIPYDEIVAKIHAARKEKAENESSSSQQDGNEVPNNNRSDATGNVQKAAKSLDLIDHSSASVWDPIDTVKRIMEGVVEERNSTNTSKSLTSPPSSRFISRMLPMQATCYASVEEIRLVTMSLLQKYLPPIIEKHKSSSAATISFKIDIKRRLCSHLNRNQVIEAVTPLLLESNIGDNKEEPQKKYGCNFSVNLSNPDFAIRIEIIKTLCGISILPRQDWYKNFNLAELMDEKDNDNNN